MQFYNRSQILRHDSGCNIQQIIASALGGAIALGATNAALGAANAGIGNGIVDLFSSSEPGVEPLLVSSVLAYAGSGIIIGALAGIATPCETGHGLFSRPVRERFMSPNMRLAAGYASMQIVGVIWTLGIFALLNKPDDEQVLSVLMRISIGAAILSVLLAVSECVWKKASCLQQECLFGNESNDISGGSGDDASQHSIEAMSVADEDDDTMRHLLSPALIV